MLITQCANVPHQQSLKRKRGKYNHYSAEHRYKMAKYAVENGVMKASKHFSKVLGKPVNESSIRTMKKSYILKSYNRIG